MGLVRRADEVSLAPHIRGQESVGLSQGEVASLDKVTHGTGVTSGGGVGIMDTGQRQHLLGGRGSNETSTARSRDNTDTNGTAVTVELVGHSVGLTTLVTPVTTTNGDNGELGGGQSTLDGVGDFTGALDTETDVAVAVTDGDESLETSALTGRRLALNRHNLHDLILERGAEKVIDDLSLLHGDGVQVDLFDGGDLTGLYQTTKLGDRHPFLLVTRTAWKKQ